MRKLFFLVTTLLFLNSCQTKKSEISELTTDKPNIILILVDDMGYSDLSCYGGEISTPNIDALAENGIRFTQFYNGARCCPTRASLLTGVYPHQAGIGKMVTSSKKKIPKGPYQGYLSENTVTLAEVLKSNGYYTAMAGKWHVGEERPHWPTDRGFDNFYGLISGAANYFDITKAKKESTVRHFAIDSTEFIPSGDDFYMTNAITENAVDFVNKAKSKDQPFFMYLAYTAPHWPLHALQEDIAKFRGTFLDGWDKLREARFARMIEMGIVDASWPISNRNEGVDAWEHLSEEQKDKMDLLMSIYAAQIYRMDVGIGEVMKQLEANGQKENTLVMFMSDNGASEEYGPFGTDYWGNFWDGKSQPGSVESYHTLGSSWANMSNTPFRYYKKDAYEGGIATPFIVSWPENISQTGTITNETGHITDIMATICDITGADYPQAYNDKYITPMEGISLKNIFFGEDVDNSRMMFWEHQGNRAVRDGDWKLVAAKDKDWELYNLKEDRTEMNNIIEKHSEIAQKLIKAYNEWSTRVGVDPEFH